MKIKLTEKKSEEIYLLVVCLLLAWLLAAHQGTQYQGFNALHTYLYWTGRMLIELAIFSAVFIAVEKYLCHYLSLWLRFALATLFSLIPFVLSITAFDLVVGLPELGLNGASGVQTSRAREFALELLFLLDNHILFCALLFLPRMLLHKGRSEKEPSPSDVLPGAEISAQNTAIPTASLFASLAPDLSGNICCMEAQEHYIQVTSTDESRMILHRFSDAVRSLPATLGMQVHRSHWVAHSAVTKVIVEGQSMKLALHCGKRVPVSRTFRAAVEKKYAT